MTSPFAVIADAIALSEHSSDPTYRDIASLLAEAPVGESFTRGLQFRLIEAFTDLLETVASRAPLLLALDDLQWADSATLLVIRDAQERLQSLPASLLLTHRPSVSGSDLRGLKETLVRRGALAVSLEGLRDSDVAHFLGAALGAQPGPALLNLGAGAAGNPFLLTELVSEVRSLVQPGPAAGQVDVPADVLPPSLRMALERRTASLSEQGRALLRTASLLGGTFEAAELLMLAGRPALELVEPLAELLDAGLLEDREQGLRFRHDLIREQTYEAIPSGARAALHLDIARSLAVADSPAFRIAHHFALAGPAAAPEAAEWLVRAAREAASRDPQTAIGLLRRALEAQPRSGDERRQIEAHLAVLLAYSGNPREAEDLARALLASPESAQIEDLIQPAMVQALFAQGRWDKVVAHVDAIRDTQRVSEQTLGRLIAEAGLARIWTGDLDGAEADANEALALGQATGDAVTTCFALGHLASVSSRRGRFKEGLEMARRGVEVAIGLPDAARRHPHISYGGALADIDRLEEAKDAFREGQRLGERVGTAWDLPLYHAFLAFVMHDLGEWDDAIAEAESGLSLAEETGAGFARVTALAFLASIAVRRGQTEAARSWIGSADAIIETSGPQWGTWWLTDARAALEAAEGSPGPGHASMRTEWEHGTIFQLMRAPFLARQAARSGDQQLIEKVRRRLSDLPAPADVPHLKASVLVSCGLIERDPAPLLEAAGLFASDGRRPSEAAAREDAGSVFAAAGRQEEARREFTGALGLYDSLGAGRDVARVMASMRALGIRLGVRAPHRRATSGWEALTSTEVKIAELAAQGRTNPEIGAQLFISRRTVQTHLSHIFAKLKIASRVELAVIASRHRL
jgi:DNA-binding CsgD family transcriptional regulator/tetratricopeptide (TPR) repeat protein